MIHLIHRVVKCSKCVGYVVEDATGYRFYVSAEDLEKYAVSNLASKDVIPEIKEVTA